MAWAPREAGPEMEFTALTTCIKERLNLLNEMISLGSSPLKREQRGELSYDEGLMLAGLSGSLELEWPLVVLIGA